ncbi:vascular endothelial growth factor A-like isoform X1 [Bufo gargarizans]|uniref:vascular endothelial growth factor A-like isoform X1 n=1 Tax=Bufo gargarizans TaxID=30331 RepID=UPI001CF1B2AA|nr:vascular endothelial growth factor A-like isoform X1 [Bufo gargarizans]
MDCVIGSSLVWFSVLLLCILTPLSVSPTPQTLKLEGQAWMDIFNRSKCQPRWVLLNLLNEFPQFSDFLFKPPCVSVQRCAGCCLDEAQSCFPIQAHIIKMQVQVHKTKSDPEYTEISVIQHTECECRAKASLQLLDRRLNLAAVFNQDRLERPHVNTTLKASRLSSTSGDKKAKKRRRKGKKGKGASKNARSTCPPCGRRRTLNPKNCKCVCDFNEKRCIQRGLTPNKERCRCEKPRS